MPGGSGKLPGIFFAKGGRQKPGIAGDFQKIAEMKRKNAEEQGRTIPENIFQDIQEMKKLQKPDDATFCNLFERKMT
jgi:hypothetical protein